MLSNEDGKRVFQSLETTQNTDHESIQCDFEAGERCQFNYKEYIVIERRIEENVCVRLRICKKSDIVMYDTDNVYFDDEKYTSVGSKCTIDDKSGDEYVVAIADEDDKYGVVDKRKIIEVDIIQVQKL
jgi:hypothetical protein